MKALNKFLSLILSCAMVMSLCIPAFAIEGTSKEVFDESSVLSIDNGKLFSAKSEDKTIAILTDDSLHLLDISISYDPSCEEVYHWAISDYPDSKFTYDDAFWKDVVAYAENHFEDSNTVHFTTTACNTSDSGVVACSSARADLVDQLQGYLGSGTYSAKERHRESYQGTVFTVYEQLSFSVEPIAKKGWSNAITVSSLIVGVLGLTATICGIYGIAASASSLLPANQSIQVYSCTGLYSHYTRAAGSNKIYNMTYRYVTYSGYDNPKGTTRATIDSGSKTVEFDKGQSYYYDYPLQVQDAYQAYKIMG